MKWSRRRRTGGFTLVEMLIVVAVIAVLVAVSIPMVNASLEKARVAADQANERAAKAAALSNYLMEERTVSITYFYKSDGTVLDQDALEGATETVAGDPGYDYGQSKGHKGSCVRVEIKVSDGVIDIDIHWDDIKNFD
ncbi:prepilin-type N-terminal cleavage/methylation domain-containing protein [uncultured Intestinimonas sp.]|uniref:prepilin-type N-terminal cleavage/methylation domain-containing protein n=1 Tax=uncultured Intestinimonas sp. TaxID=1689265 RepID=UPI0025F91D1F|nr:prepilin-type N-terminal cleavage/methylation domain-containing protein [uncultured Intestinimonas sp.]